MVSRTPWRIGARVVAAVLAAALSGAPQLAFALRIGTPPHACQCRAHGDGHRCACPLCAQQARRARRGALEELPPCHRDLALRALAEEEERERVEAGLPALKPSCGFDDPPAGPAGAERFLAPARAELVPALRPERLPPASAAGREIPAVPDLPPPILG